MEEVQNEE